ncbi:MAG TPA: LLM class flavin-dependent oxidoreductase [Marmoricola sp.]|jgi:alkanesulfonate monooxygenase SsuD/methylene tetrahydromethanopterin reductase-like flavin-dependent oxidoreductase (luciferase family)|nr:LLM class flavin-dependent oxidoreductase [Marmoricola sp.]
MTAPSSLPRIDLHLTGEQMDVHTMVDLAVHAEATGFGGLWVAEAFRDSFVPLAAIAERTSSIEIGNNVAQWTRSVPNMELAAGDLAELSGGRFVLGVGSTTRAWNEDWHGITYDRPLARMREYVAAIRALWRADAITPVDVDGEVFRIRNYLRFNGPLQYDVPIAFGVSRKAMARLTGEIADRAHFNACLSPSYVTHTLLPELAAGREAAGRPADAVRVGMLTITAVAEDEREAVRLARHQLGFYVGVADYFAGLWAHHGLSAEHDRVQELFRSGDVDGAIAAVPDEAVAAMTIAGDPDSVRARFADYAGTADYVMLYSPSFRLRKDEIERNYHAIVEAFGHPAQT